MENGLISKVQMVDGNVMAKSNNITITMFNHINKLLTSSSMGDFVSGDGIELTAI